MAALTQQEAIARKAQLAVHSYDVELDLSGAAEQDTFSSRVAIDFAADLSTPAGDGTWLEIKSHDVESAELNGQAVDLSTWHDDRLPLTGLRERNQLVVRARFAYSRTGEGLHRYTDPQDGQIYLYSQAFLDDAARMFGCFDQPDLKATFDLAVSAPPEWVVLANGNGQQADDDPGRWRFATTPRISTYLFAIAAGPYHGRRETHDGIEIGVWSRQSWAPYLDTAQLLANTRAGFDYFHGLFGVRYPFGKYDQVFVPEFNAGAMENPGLVTFRDEYYLQRGTVTDDDREELANVQLHEMAHMWFGNLVTMRWWDDLWLNESFAEYLSFRAVAEATEHHGSWTTFLAKRKTWGYLADQLSTTHPVAGEAPDTAKALLNFDGISYAKGASALRQLVAWVGDDAFLTALRQHFADHAYDNASLADLVRALSAASGRDVEAWADLWLRASGVSTLSCVTEVDDAGRYSRFAVHQAAETLRPHRVAVGLFDVGDDGALTRRRVEHVDVEATARTEVAALIGEQAAALVLPNELDLTFALLDLDARSLDTVRSHLRTLTDPLARAVIWFALDEMMSHGKLAPSALVKLVTQSMTEADPEAVTVRVLASAIVAADRWVPAERRGDLLGVLANSLRGDARTATPGGDRQLSLVRKLIPITTDVDLLLGWRDGHDLPPGLQMDDDMRWRIVHRLAVLGALDEAAIDAERERDPSTAGANHALTARAALPTLAAKEWAWSTAVEQRFSNHELEAVSAGFWSVEQADLLAPYVDRYAADLPRVARSSSAETVMVFSRMLFPQTVVAGSTVEMASGLVDGDALAHGQFAPIARRMVAERRDEMLRGLRARAAEPTSP